MKNRKTFFITMGLIVVPFVIFIILNTGKQNYNSLPYIGERIPPDGVTVKDTIYYKVPGFSLVSQTGKTITTKDLEGSIYIANFFFASCQDVCPKMNAKVETIYRDLKEFKEVKIVSHTVDPENDSVPVLAEYAKRFNADPDRWYFLTGSKEDIFKAGQGYLLPVTIEDKTVDHSQQLILVDKDGHIRGFYDGLDDRDIKRIKEDVKVLLYDELKSKRAE